MLKKKKQLHSVRANFFTKDSSLRSYFYCETAPFLFDVWAEPDNSYNRGLLWNSKKKKKVILSSSTFFFTSDPNE